MILVTGGTGLIGSHLLLALVQGNEKVRAIHRSTSNLQQVRNTFARYTNNGDDLFQRIHWVEADVSNEFSMQAALEEVQYVYHLAASVSFDPRGRKSMMHNNIQGTANVVNACLDSNITRLCYVSSTSAIGSGLPGELFTEDDLWSNSKHRSYYSISKFRSEMEVWRGMAEGLSAVIVNPSIVIGPGDWNKSSSRLFSAVWKGMKYYTEGITGYVDVRDVVSVMIRLMDLEVEGERYTVSSENLSYRQVLEMIASCLNKKPPSRHASTAMISLAWRVDWLRHMLTGRARNITRDAVKSSGKKSCFSTEKVKEASGFKFMPVADSIRDTAKHFIWDA